MNPIDFIGYALIVGVVGGAATLGLCWHLIDLAFTDWPELFLLLCYGAAVLGL